MGLGSVFVIPPK